MNSFAPGWRIRGIFPNERGVAAVEFAFLAPVLLLIMVGISQFAMLLGNYSMVENAVHVGNRFLAISRGDATPFTDTENQIYGAMGTLQKTSLSLTFKVNGTTCTSDATCSAALVEGVPATVSASYPCSLVIMGVNFLPNCTLSASTIGRVE